MADWEAMYKETEAERDRIWVALTSIAQYDPRWIWMSNNDAPNRQQLIERAFDAVIEVAFDGDMERAKDTVPPKGVNRET